MFEFEDEKLGRVKVVNVTEARSSMSSMMGDKETNYIVTKNNKPIRVVVSYETFKKAINTINPFSPRSSSSKTSEIKDRDGASPMGTGLKGLIQSKEKDLKEQFIAAALKSSPMIPRDTASRDTVPQEVSVASASAILPPPDSDVGESESIIVEQEQPPSEPVSSEPATSYVTTNTPPPNSDYFNRFKKLYEAPRYDSLFQKSVSTSTEVARSASNAPAPTVSVPSVSVSTAPTPNRRPSGGTDGNRTDASRKEGTSSHLPSIQDLLSELEQEKLTGEEEDSLGESPLSSNQVNQLLNRITK